jgi:hypothetical protein
MENRMKSPKKMVLLILALVLIISVLSTVRIVRSDSGGTVFYKNDLVYAYLGSGYDGWRSSYLKVGWDAILQYLNVAVPPSERRFSTTVLRITPSGVRQQNIDYGENSAENPLFVTPFGDNLYGMCRGVLCKLTDRGFQVATEEEQKGFGGLDHLNRAGTLEEQRDGWMTKRIGNLPNQQFEIDIAGKLKVIARNDAKNEREAAKVVIDLVRPDQSKETLYKVDGSTRWVSRAEYNRDFPPSGNK